MGRVTDPVVELRARPDVDSPSVGKFYEDVVVSWLREVVGVNPYRVNQRWVETPGGYLWSPLVQPVYNEPNIPVENLPETSMGLGMWVEVTIPWVDVFLDNPSPISPRVTYLVENGRLPRLYFSQILWVDDVRIDERGQSLYHIKEPYGSYGDVFWGPAEAFRPLMAEDMTPVSPEIEDKRIDINLSRQTMSCYEGNREVHFCRISSGRDGADTPVGNYFYIFWKLVSVHMSAGTAGAGYDLTGIGWPTFFAAGGIAIHSTFWHNNFGVRTSAGCVNARPDDAKFVSRWALPILEYDPGVIDVGSTGVSTTLVRVLES